MLRLFLRVALPVVIVICALAVWLPRHPHPAVATRPKPAGSMLKVSVAAAPLFANISSDNLQPAAAPDRSATSPALSPQQAKPNYCAPYEVPYADGCLPSL